jgi:hypothetical protein
VNNTASSLMVGFNSTVPTLFVGPASGVGTYGKVGIAKSNPATALDVNGTVTATAFAGDGSAITNIAAGTHNHDTSYVNVTGDTMTGGLTMSGASGDLTFDDAGGAISNTAGAVLVGDDLTISGAATITSNLAVDTSTLFVDSSGNRVGVGTTTPVNQLDVEGGAAIGATYSGASAAPANGLIVEGKVGIGTATPGTVGAAKLELYGAAGSTAGPHIQVVTSSDSYPVFQQLNYGHDNVAFNFDTYYDGVDWRSSDAGSNFALYKNNDKMKLAYKSGVAAGGTISFNSGIVLQASNGNVGIGTDTPADKLHVESSATTGNGAYFYTSNAANTTGQTVYALNAGATSSRAGYFENNNPANTACSLWARNTGGGEALCGSITNDVNTSNAISISTNGEGKAASFSVTKAANTNDTVYISHAGVGSGTTAALDVETSNTAHAIYGHTTGTAGRAGKFLIENAANDNDVLYIETASVVGGTTLGRLIDTNKGAYLTNTGVFTSASSRKYKKDITPLTHDDIHKMLDVVEGIEVVRFRYKGESPDQKMSIGVIAEDAPDEMTDDAKEGVQTVKAVGMLIAAMQAQQEMIDEQKQMIIQLQSELEHMKSTAPQPAPAVPVSAPSDYVIDY